MSHDGGETHNVSPNNANRRELAAVYFTARGRVPLPGLHTWHREQLCNTSASASEDHTRNDE